MLSDRFGNLASFIPSEILQVKKAHRIIFEYQNSTYCLLHTAHLLYSYRTFQLEMGDTVKVLQDEFES